MAEHRHGHEMDLLDPVDHVAELKRTLANPQPAVVIYACGCQAPIDFPDRCPVHASPVQNMIRPSICED